jgi:protein SCO1/2
MRFVLYLLTVLFAIAPSNAFSHSTENNAIASSEAAIGNRLPSLMFVDTNGNNIGLDELRGKPVVVSLIYTSCAETCPVIIENLYRAIEVAQEAFGQDSFTTITIGFDAQHDTRERMLSFARTRGINLPDWLFLSGDQATIHKLADAIGYTIIPSAGGFNHTAQVSVIDESGQIYQQIRGDEFGPPAIVEPLKDLLFGQRRAILSVGGLKDRIKLFCTVYNPNTGRYYFNYSLLIGIAIGLASLLLVLVWLIREFRLSNRPGGAANP